MANKLSPYNWKYWEISEIYCKTPIHIHKEAPINTHASDLTIWIWSKDISINKMWDCYWNLFTKWISIYLFIYWCNLFVPMQVKRIQAASLSAMLSFCKYHRLLSNRYVSWESNVFIFQLIFTELCSLSEHQDICFFILGKFLLNMLLV